MGKLTAIELAYKTAAMPDDQMEAPVQELCAKDDLDDEELTEFSGIVLGGVPIPPSEQS
jgi:hypothetical protein